MSDASPDSADASMTGVSLRFIVHENRKYQGELVYEWLLRMASKLGLHGGSVLKGIAGFGRHGVLHEQHFFELQGDLPVEVYFVCSSREAELLLAEVGRASISVFYVLAPVRYGIVGSGEDDWADFLSSVGE